jgi:hypothetical protein
MIYHEFPHWNRNPLGQRELRQFLPFFPAKSAWQVVEIALRQRRQLAPVASPKRPRESRHCFTCHGYTGKNIGIQLFSSIWDGNYLVSQEKNVEFYPISQELNTQDILECIVFFRKSEMGSKTPCGTAWWCVWQPTLWTPWPPWYIWCLVYCMIEVQIIKHHQWIIKYIYI